MIKPVLNTASYTCADNKCYLVWLCDKDAVAYEIYRNDNLLGTFKIEELDKPFMFLRFPRNTLFRNNMLLSKVYVDNTVKRFNTYEYKIRPIYENNIVGEFSNIKHVKCE